MSAFSFGTTATTSANTLGFGGSTFGGVGTNPPAFGQSTLSTGGTGSNLFGSTQPTAAFGTTGSGFNAQQPAFSLNTTRPAFSTSFGKPLTSTAPGSMFGVAGGFGAPTIQQQAQQMSQWQGTEQQEIAMRLATAVVKPAIFGDERDQIVAKFNQLQALIGQGKAVYAVNQPPVPLSPKNLFCKFKAYTYIRKPSHRDEEGLVGIVFSKSADEVAKVEPQLTEAIHKLLGGKPELQVEAVATSSLMDSQSELLIRVKQLLPNGNQKRVPASELVRYLMQPHVKSNLESMTVVELCPRVQWSDEDMRQFQESIPEGFSPFDWLQAQQDNPKPDSLMPIPIVGFQELADALKSEQVKQQMLLRSLQKMQEDYSTMSEWKAKFQNRMDSTTQRLEDISLRSIKLLCSALSNPMRVRGRVEDFEVLMQNAIEDLLRHINGAPSCLQSRLGDLLSALQTNHKALAEKASKLRQKPAIADLSDDDTKWIYEASDNYSRAIDALRIELGAEKEQLTQVLRAVR